MKAEREPFFWNEDFDDIILRMLKAILAKDLRCGPWSRKEAMSIVTLIETVSICRMIWGIVIC